MKVAIKNYSFNKTTGEVTFSDYVTIRLDSILAVINVTARVIIYKTGDPVLGGTVATNKLTVAYDTSAMADTDKLLILYDDANYNAAGAIADAANTDATTSGSLIAFVKGLVSMVKDVWDSTAHVLKVTILPLSNTIDTITAYPATDAIMNGTTALTPKFAVIQTTDTGSNALVAAVTNKKIRVLSYVLISAGTVTAYFASAATAKTGVMPLVANMGVSSGYCPLGQFETVAGEALNLVKSGDVDVSGHLLYVEI